jgi:serine/threonine-protein kinase
MIGRVFRNRYEAVRQLGEGGMGRVFLARDLELNRQVVVKVMHEHIAADTTFRERFRREKDLMAKFEHMYAVRLYDALLDDPSGPCIIMEYVKGVNLDALLAKSGKFTPARVGRLLGQLCEALQAAHELHIVHRDLKPANIMVVDADSPREKIKVMDFGLAKDPEEMKKVTDTNLDFAVGTPGYICPEQIRGEEMDHRGDIYSVGVILYELLSGKLPFRGHTTMDVMLAHATDPPPTFAEQGLSDWVPAPIEDIVLQCLAKDPSERPQSARELADRYEAALNADATGEGYSRATFDPGAPPPFMPFHDPTALNFQMEAWMPEKIAIIKLRGFVHDLGGDVIESIPGLIRVRFGSRRTNGWFGLVKADLLDMELRLQQIDPNRENRLHISVLYRPNHKRQLQDKAWVDKCSRLFVEVRAYLMGTIPESN